MINDKEAGVNQMENERLKTNQLKKGLYKGKLCSPFTKTPLNIFQ